MSHNKGQYTFGQLVTIVEDLKLMLEKLRKEFDDHKNNFDVHLRNIEPEEDQCTSHPADLPDNSKQKNDTVNSRISLEGVHIKLENDVDIYSASPAVSSKENTRRDISSRDVSGGAKQNFDIQRDLLKIEKDLLESVGEEANYVKKRRSNKESGRKRKSGHHRDNENDDDGKNLLAIEMNNYVVGDDDADLNHGSLLAIKAEPKLEPEERQRMTKIQKLKKIKSVHIGKSKKKVDRKSGSESASNKVGISRDLDKSITKEGTGRRKRRHTKNLVKYNSFDMDESDVDDEATNNENTEEEDVEEEEDQGKKPKKLYCKCRGPATKDDMIGCDGPCQVGVIVL